ncbi:MAG: hypothetical protein JNN07_06565 [Verrucomicrobiales bacterium]|nr:hypothetical protein [Verrucomicrobiales bacterium]
MRFLSLFALVPALALVACSESSTAEIRPLSDGQPAAASPGPGEVASEPRTVKAPPPTSAAKAPPPAPARTSPYRLLGILDPDRERMVAFALKVPSDWVAKQEFHRKWEGAVGLPQIGITLSAPDGRSQIVYFPSTQYLYSEGPMTANLRAQKRSFGLPEQASPNELAPMPPVQYLREVFLPTLAQSGMTLQDLGNEKTAPQTRGENGQVQTRGSLDGKLPNGNRARIEARIWHSSRQMGTDTYHSWSVVASITQTSTGDLEAIHAHTRIAQDSIVQNPAWVKIEQEAQARGYQANQDASRQQHEATMAQIRANTEAMTRGHQQRMDAIRQFGEANTARFNQRMDNMDREQRIRVDTIRGESKYVNPTTGQQVKVEDGYKHVYNSQQHPNLFLGTDTPINPGALDWQELQKVSLEHY